MNWLERIIIDSVVFTGKSVIKGTRLAVEFIIDMLAHDWTESEILRNYPGLDPSRHSSVSNVCKRFVHDIKGLSC